MQKIERKKAVLLWFDVLFIHLDVSAKELLQDLSLQIRSQHLLKPAFEVMPIHSLPDVKDLLHCVTCLQHVESMSSHCMSSIDFPPVLICIKVYLAHNYCSRLQGRSSAGF